MEKKEFVLKFEESEELYSFNKNINLVSDKKLVKFLGRENVRNSNSTLIIKSMNLPIYDVLQFKINIAKIGSFLFNFSKEYLNEKTREELLSKISELRSDEEPTKETQCKKISKLIEIVSKYELIYASFVPNGPIEISFDEFAEVLKNSEHNFPILYLDSKQKDVYKVEDGQFVFRKFAIDYIFTSIFALLMSFGVMTGVYQIYNKQSVAAFLLVLAFIFFGVLSYSIYSVIYKEKAEVNKKLKYFLLIYTTIGIALGIVLSYIVCKFAMKAEVEGLSLTKIGAISAGISLALSIASIYVPKLINLIVKKI